MKTSSTIVRPLERQGKGEGKGEGERGSHHLPFMINIDWNFKCGFKSFFTIISRFFKGIWKKTNLFYHNIEIYNEQMFFVNIDLQK